jgi:hypothetical protein
VAVLFLLHLHVYLTLSVEMTVTLSKFQGFCYISSAVSFRRFEGIKIHSKIVTDIADIKNSLLKI